MSFWYLKGKEKLLSGSIDFTTDSIKVAAIAAEDYTAANTHEFFNEVTRYSGSSDYTLSNPTITNGVLDADDAATAYAALSADGTKDIDGLVVYKDTGDSATSPLLLYIDGFTVQRPNGGNISITWDNTSNKIAAL